MTTLPKDYKNILAAISNKDEEWIVNHKELINMHSVNAMHQHTPLTWAIVNVYDSVAKLLISLGADVNKKDFNGWSPVYHSLCLTGNDMIKLLLESGADIHYSIKIYVYDNESQKEVDWYLIDYIYNGLDRYSLQRMHLLLKHGANPYLSASLTTTNSKIRKIVDREFWKFVKTTWIPVGLALRHLSAQELLQILFQLCPGADFLPKHKTWKLVTTIKHWK